MNKEEKIEKINQVINDYFENNTKEDSVAVKALMPDFIKADIFAKDEKNGLPIRKVLRTLDEQNTLDKIPNVHPERKKESIYWYFLRTGASYISDPNDTGFTKKEKAKATRASSDEYYVLNLCDEILDTKGARQHKFEFLLGDYHKDGISRTILPVDGYYQKQNLVIEYMEKQHTEAVDSFDNPDRITISGVNRSEQRKLYDQRKKKGLTANDIQLLVIAYSAFICDSNNSIIRDREKDLEVLNGLLKGYL